MLARRVGEIALSPTLRVNDLATALRAAGEDVLDFSAGQPDFPTPEEVKAAGKRAIDENKTRYTPNAGLPELRRAVADSLLRERGFSYAPEQVLISPGAKASLFFACQAILDPGDEVIVPAPYWVSYPEQIRLCGARPIYVQCSADHGFRLQPADLERAITSRTRALILNDPCNPTGASYSRDDLAPLAEVCGNRDLWVIADEIYARLLYDGRSFTSIAALGDAIRERTVLIGGVSKTYAMTGWRIGFAVGTREVIGAMAKLQSHVTSNATSISQWASVAALQMSGKELDRRRTEFQQRRDLTVRRLSEMSGVQCAVPEGAFYVFPRVSGCFGRTPSGESLTCGNDVAEYLLREAKVAVVPGEAFGSDRHIRISYAASLERITEGLDRMERALSLVRGEKG